jgi:hypothetical protein
MKLLTDDNVEAIREAFDVPFDELIDITRDRLIIIGSLQNRIPTANYLCIGLRSASGRN